MDRLIKITLIAIGVASLGITLIALTWPEELTETQVNRVVLPWVLTICAIFMVFTALMATYFRKLATKLETMQKVAMTDHLTGVANRMALTETLQESLVQTALKDGHLAVISLDLDDFKLLNDEHGHHAGDTALRVAAERIANSVRRYEKVFRMGGDEFLCLIFDPDPRAAAQNVVDRLRTSFCASMDLGGRRRIVTPSIGIAIAQQGESWDTVFKRSDAAMYWAKQSKFSYSFCGGSPVALVETEARKSG